MSLLSLLVGGSIIIRILFLIHSSIKRQKSIEAGLRKHHNNFEKMVQERTAELNKANEEMEAFCYSISHDLRSPLRAINGFSQALIDDYGTTIDADGKNFLNRIKSNSIYSFDLIDGLLTLFSLSRQNIKCEHINLASLANKVFSKLEPCRLGQKIEFKCEINDPVYGDYTLLRVVMENLLLNAIKYSQNMPVTIITVGEKHLNGERVILVKDNGAGFDIQYAKNLFGIFQRLHTDNEFKGAGIGLATVQRIIQRHGGKIWAEAEIDKGATFYFTLADRRQP